MSKKYAMEKLKENTTVAVDSTVHSMLLEIRNKQRLKRMQDAIAFLYNNQQKEAVQ